MKNRISSIELLKIIAMFLIAIMHSLPRYGNTEWISYIQLGSSTNNISIIILNILYCTGYLGNLIFIVCSAYFLLESKRTKKEKIINVILDTFIISIFWLLPTLLLNIEISGGVRRVIKQLFPILFQNNWFITCYILLYLTHPLLNIVINKLNQHELLRVNFLFVFIYCVIQFFVPGAYYYNHLIGFIVIYFIVAYSKKYLNQLNKNNKINVLCIILSICINASTVLFMNFLGLKISYFSDKVLYFSDNLVNPCYVVFAISVFNLFYNKAFFNKNKYINYISSLSLIYYCVHENQLFREFIRPYFYKTTFLYGHILFWTFIEAIGLFIFGLVISIIYKETIQKIVYYLSHKIYIIIKSIYNKIEYILLKIT